MNSIKRFTLVCVLILSVILLVGCGGGGSTTGGGEVPDDVTIDTIKADVLSVFEKYANADHGSFKFVVNNDKGTTTFESIFNFEEERSGVISLKKVITNKEGTISVYIEDEVAYTNLYDQLKTKEEIDLDTSELIAMEYGFDSFSKLPILLFNESFFASATLDSYKDNVATISLNIGMYNIDNEEENEDLTIMFDGIKECLSVTVELTHNENKEISNLKINLVGETTETIELQLLGTSETDIEIEFPDFAEYE